MRTILMTLLLVGSFLIGRAQEGNFVENDMLANMKPGDKAALLMVHFGTSFDETRSLTIDALNAKAKEAFPELEVREAYTSRMIIHKLKKQGIEKKTPMEALFSLRSEGYTHVVVQSSNIINGVEMDLLRVEVQSLAPFFTDIRVGEPLLYSVEDSKKVVEILTARHAPDSNAKKSKEHVVLVGHGTYVPSTATYSQIDYMLHAEGYTNFHVGTIEGYPTFDTMLAQLKEAKAKSVTLVPFMFVAGDHAHNDIAGEWKEALEGEGFTVNACMEGLGQVPEIQDIFIDHIRFSLTHRGISLVKKHASDLKW